MRIKNKLSFPVFKLKYLRTPNPERVVNHFVSKSNKMSHEQV